MLAYARNHSSPQGALARRIELLTSEPLFPAGFLLEVSKPTLKRANTFLVFQVGGGVRVHCVCQCACGVCGRNMRQLWVSVCMSVEGVCCSIVWCE